MQTLSRGQRLKLADLGLGQQWTAKLELEGLPADVSCFGLDEAGVLSDDRYFVFFNQPQSPEGAVQATLKEGQGQFNIDLSRLPSSIRRLTFTATVDEGNLSQLAQGRLSFHNESGEVARFEFRGSDFSGEKAVMVLEVYFKDVWRVSAVGQGFSGGLKALLQHFGGEALEETPSTAGAPLAEQTPPTAQKVTLEKSGEKVRVSLKKGKHRFHVNLNWNPVSSKLFGLIDLGSPDIDLGCLYSTFLGPDGVVQPLGYLFGSADLYPFVHLDQDDRTGRNSQGENLYFEKPSEIKKGIIYAYVYKSISGFKKINARVTISDSFGNNIIIPLNNPSPHLICCAVALVGYDGSEFQFQKEERYFIDQETMSKHYQFDLIWQPGTKGE